jgi:hypothetical protein
VSNTIRRPRKRPRLKSYSFRTLGWLIRREAMWNIRQGWRCQPWDIEVRYAFTRERSDLCERHARAVLKFNEARRYYP